MANSEQIIFKPFTFYTHYCVQSILNKRNINISDIKCTSIIFSNIHTNMYFVLFAPFIIAGRKSDN